METLGSAPEMQLLHDTSAHRLTKMHECISGRFGLAMSGAGEMNIKLACTIDSVLATISIERRCKKY